MPCIYKGPDARPKEEGGQTTCVTPDDSNPPINSTFLSLRTSSWMDPTKSSQILSWKHPLFAAFSEGKFSDNAKYS